MGLTSTGLRVLTLLLAIIAPLLVAVLWHQWRGERGVGATAALLVGILVAQGCALGAAFVAINDHYQFYNSVGDVLGRNGGLSHIQVNRKSGGTGGRITMLTVHGEASKTNAQVLVWLPHQYDEPAFANHRFPVLEFLPGQPNYPGGAFERFELGRFASQAIAAGVKPFVVVVPPIMVRPPSDTECTDIPHGPQALSWLTKDVPAGVTSSLRVDPPGPHWSIAGWSTGGFCAAKVVLTDPALASAAVSLGGYYQPNTTNVWPHLFGGSATVRNLNSPQWLYTHHGGMRGVQLLIISGRQDKDSWPSTREMLRVTHGDPQVSYIAFPKGGHNVAAYAAYGPQMIRWLSGLGAMG